MASRKVACWDTYSVLNTQLHFIQLYQNVLAFVAICMQMTLKYTYRFLLNWLLLLSHQLKLELRIFFSWMIGNKLSVNPDKTEYLLFNSKNINVPVSINLNLNTISPSECAKNLGVIFQSDMSMDKRILSVVKTCFHQLHEFRHIRSFIPKSAAIIFAHAFIHFGIDYCNSLFYGTQLTV